MREIDNYVTNPGFHTMWILLRSYLRSYVSRAESKTDSLCPEAYYALTANNKQCVKCSVHQGDIVPGCSRNSTPVVLHAHIHTFRDAHSETTLCQS